MRVNEPPDSPLTTEDGATKIGAGLCRSQPRNTKCNRNETLNDVAWRFGAAGWSCVNIGHYGLVLCILLTLFAKMER